MKITPEQIKNSFGIPHGNITEISVLKEFCSYHKKEIQKTLFTYMREKIKTDVPPKNENTLHFINCISENGFICRAVCEDFFGFCPAVACGGKINTETLSCRH